MWEGEVQVVVMEEAVYVDSVSLVPRLLPSFLSHTVQN